jgi:hypothetical protein
LYTTNKENIKDIIAAEEKEKAAVAGLTVVDCSEERPTFQ